MPLNILLVYGEGGHHAQAMRLMKQMQSLDDNLNFIHITDSPAMQTQEMKNYYTVPPIRHKNSSFNPLESFMSYVKAVTLST